MGPSVPINSIAAANAGVLGLISSSGITTDKEQPEIFNSSAAPVAQILRRQGNHLENHFQKHP